MSLAKPSREIAFLRCPVLKSGNATSQSVCLRSLREDTFIPTNLLMEGGREAATGPSAAPIHGPAKATRESAFLTPLVHDGSHRPLGSNATHPRSSEKGIFHPPRTQPRVANAPPTRWDGPQGGPQADSHHSVREICAW